MGDGDVSMSKKKMSKKEVISYLAEKMECNKVDVEAMLKQQNEMLALIAEIMNEEEIDSARLGDLILQRKEVKQRDFTNPKTGENQNLEEKEVIKVKYKRKRKYGSGKEE